MKPTVTFMSKSEILHFVLVYYFSSHTTEFIVHFYYFSNQTAEFIVHVRV